jgi:hypothetical protein
MNIFEYWQNRENDAITADLKEQSNNRRAQAHLGMVLIEIHNKKQDERYKTWPLYADLEAEMESIELELIRYKDETLGPHRRAFLLEKRRFLEEINKKLQDELSFLTEENFFEHEAADEKFSQLRQAFEILKKPIDVSDDVSQALKNSVPAIVAPILIAVAGFIIHLGEGYKGAKEAYTAYKNEKIGQQKTRILTGVLTVLAAATGVGLSAALLAATVGATVAGAVFMPFLIPALLTGIYGMALWRKSYILHQARKAEQFAKEHYEQSLQEIEENRTSFQEIQTLNREESILKIKFSDIIDKKKSNQPLAEEENKQYAEYQNKLSEISEKRVACETQMVIRYAKLENSRRLYQACHERRLKAERDVGFAVPELFGSILVSCGVALGIAALVGASIATFGALPLALIITGITIGVVTKTFEHVDNKNNHKYSSGVRRFFKKLFSSSKKPSPTEEDTLTKSVMNQPAINEDEKEVKKIKETTVIVDSTLHIDPSSAITEKSKSDIKETASPTEPSSPSTNTQSEKNKTENSISDEEHKKFSDH